MMGNLIGNLICFVCRLFLSGFDTKTPAVHSLICLKAISLGNLRNNLAEFISMSHVVRKLFLIV